LQKSIEFHQNEIRELKEENEMIETGYWFDLYVSNHSLKYREKRIRNNNKKIEKHQEIIEKYTKEMLTKK
jgi:hypothetical protein